MEDAGELRRKAERWRTLALSLNDRDWRNIEALAAELEQQADTLSGGDQDRERDGSRLKRPVCPG